MMTKNYLESLLIYLHKVGNKFIFDELGLKAIKKALPYFKEMRTKGYEIQYSRLVNYFKKVAPLETIWLYDDETEILRMCIGYMQERLKR